LVHRCRCSIRGPAGGGDARDPAAGGGGGTSPRGIQRRQVGAEGEGKDRSAGYGIGRACGGRGKGAAWAAVAYLNCKFGTLEQLPLNPF
jgi:hypothetical protein